MQKTGAVLIHRHDTAKTPLAPPADSSAALRTAEEPRPMVIAGYLTLCFLMLVALWLYPRGPNLIIVTNPFDPPEAMMRVVRMADASFVASGRYHWIASIYSAEPGLMQRLFASGALFAFRDYAPASCFQEQSQ